MFKSSRRKIVASIMTILVLLWMGTLCVIYGSSYLEVSRRNRDMLSRHVELYRIQEEPPAEPDSGRGYGKPRPDPNDPHFENTPAFQLSTFYSVSISQYGELLSVTNPKPALHDDDELVSMARTVIESGKTSGVKNNLIYHMADKDGYILVAFMDNTIVQESMTTLFRYTLIFGGLAIFALFFLAVYLARKIVKPLEDSYQKQKQFISDAGHELKTPVSVISANAELLSREIGENPWLSNIQYENERMGGLISQLLELARAEHAAPPMEPVDLSRLVRGEALPFESLMFDRGLSFSCRIEDGLYVLGNETQLKQLAAILLDNALKHCLPEKDVSLTLWKNRHSQVILSVVNDSEEIPPDELDRLFDRFYRRDQARTGESGHYGLGLAIASSIALSHDGGIGVHCEDGKVIFSVMFPLLNRFQ